MVLIDANIVLRYLLDDHPELSEKATQILETEQTVLLIEVACEVVYVLQKVYQVERPLITEQLTDLLIDGKVYVEQSEVFIAALHCYGKSRLDFVDTLLWAYRKVEQQTVMTFDKKLQIALNKLDSI